MSLSASSIGVKNGTTQFAYLGATVEIPNKLMSTSDFTIERTSVADTEPGGLAGISVDDLAGVLDIVPEEIILVQRSSGNILWSSSACQGVSHKLGSVSNINEFPSLYKMIEEALPQDAGTQLQAKWHTRDSAWQQYIGDRRKSAVSVLIRPHNPNHIWVRFHRSSARDDYLRQSLAANEKLFSTSRAISVSEMVTTLAHEINQPLGTLVNIVNGVKSRLSSAGEGTEEIFEALNLAQKQGRFASDILLRLRDFAQARKPVIEKFNVVALIGSTLELLDWVFAAEEVNVNLNIRDSEVELAGDATLLQQVLVNLLRNSVDAMVDVKNTDRQITIVVSKADNKVSIQISDTGHGISDDLEQTLFTPFKSRKKDGMGVGLNICRSFIELHQGQFWFSRNDDCGCTAHIVIPGGLLTTSGGSGSE